MTKVVSLIDGLKADLKALHKGGKWPTKVAGPQPSEVELLTALALIKSWAPRARNTLTVQAAAIAMYLRADGASNAQVMGAFALAQSKQNIITELGDGNGSTIRGAKLVTKAEAGGQYTVRPTAKGLKAVKAWFKANGYDYDALATPPAPVATPEAVAGTVVEQVSEFEPA